MDKRLLTLAIFVKDRLFLSFSVVPEAEFIGDVGPLFPDVELVGDTGLVGGLTKIWGFVFEEVLTYLGNKRAIKFSKKFVILVNTNHLKFVQGKKFCHPYKVMLIIDWIFLL